MANRKARPERKAEKSGEQTARAAGAGYRTDFRTG